MLLFKQEHVAMILSGQKRQTRRLWPHGCRVKVGSIHQARTRMLDKSSTFAMLRIMQVWQEKLRNISMEDSLAEGYSTTIAYLEAFRRINKVSTETVLNTVVWAVEFEVEK